ncbi:dual specificity protein kinase shkD-like [Anastrepha obliqua]|uniref:dual specificity protein kinase shkD-like n=1 Tax=Anastrepha obliqua TaxID=95512 RepID=UPI0024094B45|nr:dual specificity protein kinase shkD-like [Anastrepha obliqua]
MHDAFNQELNRELQYNVDALQEFVRNNVPLLNEQQKQGLRPLSLRKPSFASSSSGSINACPPPPPTPHSTSGYCTSNNNNTNYTNSTNSHSTGTSTSTTSHLTITHRTNDNTTTAHRVGISTTPSATTGNIPSNQLQVKYFEFPPNLALLATGSTPSLATTTAVALAASTTSTPALTSATNSPKNFYQSQHHSHYYQPHLHQHQHHHQNKVISHQQSQQQQQQRQHYQHLSKQSHGEFEGNFSSEAEEQLSPPKPANEGAVKTFLATPPANKMGRREIKRSNTSGSTIKSYDGGSGKYEEQNI